MFFVWLDKPEDETDVAIAIEKKTPRMYGPYVHSLQEGDSVRCWEAL